MTTLTNFARIDKAAKANGWTVDTRTLAEHGWFLVSRSGYQMIVQLAPTGAVAGCKYGLFGQNRITGEDKVGQIVGLLEEDEPEFSAAEEAANLRQKAARELAAEFGTDESEWLV